MIFSYIENCHIFNQHIKLIVEELHQKLFVRYLKLELLFRWFQFKMKRQMHYGEDDCPLAVPSSFPKDEELHFEIEMMGFSKAKVRY